MHEMNEHNRESEFEADEPREPRAAAHDPLLEGLLDEALAPAEPPAGFEARVVDAAVGASRRAQSEREALSISHEPVGWSSFDGWRRLAASLAVAAGLALAMVGAWALFEPAAPPTPDRLAGPAQVVDRAEPAQPVSIAAVEGELRALELAAAGDFDPVDERLELLALRLELTPFDAHWPATEPLARIGAEPLMDEWELTWVY